MSNSVFLSEERIWNIVGFAKHLFVNRVAFLRSRTYSRQTKFCRL